MKTVTNTNPSNLAARIARFFGFRRLPAYPAVPCSCRTCCPTSWDRELSLLRFNLEIILWEERALAVSHEDERFTALATLDRAKAARADGLTVEAFQEETRIELMFA